MLIQKEMKMDSHSKKVLITGIDSFTGKYIVNICNKNGFLVYGTSTQLESEYVFKINLVENIEKLNCIILDLKPEVVIHLAAISFVQHSDVLDFYKVNVLATENLLKAIKNTDYKPDKILLASSAAVYGNQSVNLLHEDLIPNANNHYGISKLAMELMAKSYFNEMPIIITRPFNYTGIGQNENFIIPKIVSHFRSRKSEIVLGNLDTYREYNNVEWLANIYFYLTLKSQDSFIINICSSLTYSIGDILDICS